jgi:6,7-dimethyl-8-ribityllumazine synthase
MQARYAIVVSDFNEEITQPLLDGALARFKQKSIDMQQISVTHVPGAVEIPLAAKLLADTGQYDAIICLGAVIKGDTNHYDYVCEQVSQGCQRVMLDLEIPVIFGVLTTTTVEQAVERIGGAHGHKGYDAADAAISMVKVVNDIRGIKNVK